MISAYLACCYTSYWSCLITVGSSALVARLMQPSASLCWIKSSWSGGTATVQTWLHRPHLWNAEMMLPKETESTTLYPLFLLRRLWSKPNKEKTSAIFVFFLGDCVFPLWGATQFDSAMVFFDWWQNWPESEFGLKLVGNELKGHLDLLWN